MISKDLKTLDLLTSAVDLEEFCFIMKHGFELKRAWVYNGKMSREECKAKNQKSVVLCVLFFLG